MTVAMTWAAAMGAGATGVAAMAASSRVGAPSLPVATAPGWRPTSHLIPSQPGAWSRADGQPAHRRHRRLLDDDVDPRWVGNLACPALGARPQLPQRHSEAVVQATPQPWCACTVTRRGSWMWASALPSGRRRLRALAATSARGARGVAGLGWACRLRRVDVVARGPRNRRRCRRPTGRGGGAGMRPGRSIVIGGLIDSL